MLQPLHSWGRLAGGSMGMAGASHCYCACHRILEAAFPGPDASETSDFSYLSSAESRVSFQHHFRNVISPEASNSAPWCHIFIIQPGLHV